MGATLRYLRRELLALTVIVAVTVGALLIVVRSHSFGVLLQHRVNAYLAEHFVGSTTFGEINSWRWSQGVTIRDLSVRDGSQQIVHIPRLELGYALIPLLWHEARLKVIAYDPDVHLVRNRDGQWNILQAYASKTVVVTSHANGFEIRLDSIGLRHASIDVAPNGVGGPHYRLRSSWLDARLEIPSSGVRFNATRLATRLEVPAMPSVAVEAALSYQNVKQPAELNVDSLKLATPTSSASLAGKLVFTQTYGIDAVLKFGRLTPQDLARLVPSYPLRDDLNGNVALKGPANALHVEARIGAGKASLGATIDSDLTRVTPTFDGEVALTRFDLSKLTIAQQLAGMINAVVAARGVGTDIAKLDLEARIDGHHIGVGANALGTVTMSGSAKGGVARVAGTYAAGIARVFVDGSAKLAANPHYHLLLSTQHINVAQVPLLAAAPTTDLNSRIVVDGSGFALAKLDTIVEGQATPSRVSTIPITSIAISSHIRAGRAEISKARFVSSGTILNLAGSVGFVSGTATRLSYSVRAASIAPWLTLVRLTGDGQLNADGTLTGSMLNPGAIGIRTRGTVECASLSVIGLSAASASATFDFGEIGRTTIPYGNASAKFNAPDLRGVQLHSLVAQVQVDRSSPPAARILLTAQDIDNRVDSLAASVIYQPNRIAANLSQLTLNLADNSWRLTHDAQFARDRRGLTLANFELRSGSRSLALDMALPVDGPQKITLRATQFDLATLKPVTPGNPSIAGSLTADVQIGGIAAAPSIDASLDGTGLAMNSQPLGDLGAKLHYEAEDATVDATLRQDRAHIVSVRGGIPMNLSWANGFLIHLGTNTSLKILSPGLRLAPFAQFAPKAVRNVGGLIAIDLALTGPLTHPVTNGTISLNSAAGEIVPLGVNVTEVKSVLLLSPTELRFTEISARAGDGTLTGGGSVRLSNYLPGAIGLRLNLHNWPAISTRRYQATIDADLNASGSADAPKLSGVVQVVNGTIHPDLAFLTNTGPLAPDPTITVIRAGQTLPDFAATGPPLETNTAPSQSDTIPAAITLSESLDRIAVDIKIAIHRDTWIRHPDASAELEGQLQVSRKPGKQVIVVGQIQTVRGWMAFHGRRFDLASGTILFTGGRRIDPSLDIDARLTVSEYMIDVLVTGVASKPILKLQSSPQLAQADILSLILFGKTSSALGKAERTSLRQQGVTMAAGAAAATIGKEISQSLGLESLGFDLSGVGAGGNEVGFGRYVTRDIYVSASQDVSGVNGKPARKVTVQYYIMRWLSIATSNLSDGSSEISISLSKQY
jgi:autotransporter translocation and assembly factor TamB